MFLRPWSSQGSFSVVQEVVELCRRLAEDDLASTTIDLGISLCYLANCLHSASASMEDREERAMICIRCKHARMPVAVRTRRTCVAGVAWRWVFS